MVARSIDRYVNRSLCYGVLIFLDYSVIVKCIRNNVFMACCVWSQGRKEYQGRNANNLLSCRPDSWRRRLGGVRRWQPCRMPAALQLLPATFLVLSSLLTITEACSSRSTPKPRPPAPTARPNVTFHTYACPPAYATWYCLNGATCFTVKIAESLLYNCECANGYMGQRCEFKDLEGSYLPSRQRVASIASGATIAVFLVVIVCASLYIRYQRRLKLSRATSCVDGGGDLERRDPFSRPRPTALPLSRVTTDSGRGVGLADCPTTSLYMHQLTGAAAGATADVPRQPPPHLNPPP